MKAKPLDLGKILTQGGKSLLDFLNYCVRSIEMDPLFIFLVQEYRNAPTVGRAVALYDIFCAPNAVGRVSAEKTIPPYNVGFAELMRPLKMNWTRLQTSRLTAVPCPVPPVLPPKYLFDTIVTDLEKHSKSLPRIRRRYKPTLSPVENLPGGTMSEIQRHFVDKVWQPIIRPHLVAAGFWRIATVA